MVQPPELPDDERGRKRLKRRVIVILIVGAILGLTHDIIITNVLAYWIAWTDTRPKTFIKKTVDFPESVYWEDNVYHGYNEEERLLMVRCYLDGIHLKTMAMNGPDGKVYLYTATPEDRLVRQTKIKKEKQGRTYFNMLNYLKNETKPIADREKILNRSELPQLNYSVVINQVQLTAFQSRYLCCDEIVITDHSTNEVVAYNRRLMRFYYQFGIPPFGGCRSTATLNERALFGLPDLYKMDDQSILKYKKTDNLIDNFKCKRTYKCRL